MANVHYIDYAPVRTSLMNDGDFILVRNADSKLGVNRIYQLSEFGFNEIPNPYQGRSGVVEYVKSLAEKEA